MDGRQIVKYFEDKIKSEKGSSKKTDTLTNEYYCQTLCSFYKNNG